jgi:hypothetical protein
VKKWIVIGVAGLLLTPVLLIGLVLLVNMRGGLKPAYAGVSRIPVLGRLIEIQQAETPADGADAERAVVLPGGRDVPYLRFGSEARLTKLVGELELKKAEYEALLLQVQRKSRELEAWEKQLTVERDQLRETFRKEKEKLAEARNELDLRESQMESRLLAIKDNEQANLTSLAAIYDKMAPEQAAEILAKMYEDGQQDSVVTIIYLMQERSAAKTLEAFPDATIGAQITGKLQHIVKPG